MSSNWHLCRRLLALAWRYRAGCLKVLVLQIGLLALGLSSLSFWGLGIDYLRYQITPDANPPHWPFGWQPAATWSPTLVIGAIGVAILLFGIVRALLTYAYTVRMNQLTQGQVVVDLRAAVYDKLQRLSFRFFDDNATGAIINRVTGDVQNARSFIDAVVIQLIIMVLSLSVYLVYMLNLHPKLTLACLATTPLLWLASAQFSRLVQPHYVRSRELMDEMIRRVAEYIQGIQVIKGFAREPEITAEFQQANRTVREQQQKIFRCSSLFVPGILFITQINIFIALLYGGTLVIRNEFPLGLGLVVFIGLIQQFSAQVQNLANVNNTALQSLTGARRVFEILDAPVAITNPLQPVALPAAQGGRRVQFDNVSFSHIPGEVVLADVSFEVQPGQCVAILGATGAGKSALMSLLPRFYDPTHGRVLVDGLDLRQLDVDELRRNIGTVFQESFLFSNTIAANIAFGHPEASREQIERAARIAAAHDFIQELPKGYDSVLRETGSNLSGGQRQRLAIARAILLDPAILVLDDPTAAVDPQTEREILDALAKAMQNRTTFIVAHRLSALRRADLVIVLDEGRIVQRGTHAELMHQPGHYRDIAAVQFAEGAPR
ncbi:MAG: putative ABC transporter ATP-binding protein [Verrucomicrobiae bacterium]|nr:putative ABC transporter ATP-binding protein [Verrucomicrobiae bacterium]